MMNPSRRTLLSVGAAAIPAAALFLSGCASTTPLTPAQVVADAKAVVTALGTAVTQMGIDVPTLVPAALVTKMKNYIADASSVLDALSSSMAATVGASVMQQVVSDVVAVLNTVGGIAGLPSQYTMIIQAAAVILPTLQAFVTSTLGIVTASARVKASGTMTLAQARAVLAAR
jgi:hypothetical protein